MIDNKQAELTLIGMIGMIYTFGSEFILNIMPQRFCPYGTIPDLIRVSTDIQSLSGLKKLWLANIGSKKNAKNDVVPLGTKCR